MNISTVFQSALDQGVVHEKGGDLKKALNVYNSSLCYYRDIEKEKLLSENECRMLSSILFRMANVAYHLPDGDIGWAFTTVASEAVNKLSSFSKSDYVQFRIVATLLIDSALAFLLYGKEYEQKYLESCSMIAERIENCGEEQVPLLEVIMNVINEINEAKRHA